MGTVAIPNRPAGTDVRAIAPILADFDAITAVMNGSLDADNLDLTVREALGITKIGSVRRGKSIIPTEESRTNVAFGLLGAVGDKVSNIVLPTDGLIAFAYRAMVKESVASAMRAAVFLGANQIKTVLGGAGTPAVVDSGVLGGTTNTYGILYSSNTFTSGGSLLVATNSGSLGGAYTGDVATGMDIQVGYLFATAGTYDVSVQYKASSGSVTVKNRSLWVWTMGF